MLWFHLLQKKPMNPILKQAAKELEESGQEFLLCVKQGNEMIIHSSQNWDIVKGLAFGAQKYAEGKLANQEAVRMAKK